MKQKWEIQNPGGMNRVIVTARLIGSRWLKILTDAGCRVEVYQSGSPASRNEIDDALGQSCDGVIGQLKENWNRELLTRLKTAKGRVYSNCAVGYNNVDMASATELGIPVGNTPGVLTQATAELAVALAFAVARRIPEADAIVRGDRFSGWHLDLLLGDLFGRRTLGVVGAGRIGSAFAKMMVEGHRMNLIYFGRKMNERLETSLAAWNKYLTATDEQPVSFRRAETLEELLKESDVVSLHTALNESTHHLIDGSKLALMKKNAILINVSRGPVIDERALVEHCRRNPEFRAGLDVYEDEPALKPGLRELPNVVLLPHIGSATFWTREAMSTIAARNVAAVLSGYPVWKGEDVEIFLGEDPPKAVPSIVNAKELGL